MQPSLFQGGGEALQAAKATLARVERVLSDDNIADLSQSVRDLRQTAEALVAHRAMLGTFDQAAGDIASSAVGVRQIVHGDGRHAFADLAVAAHDLKDTAHVAHGMVVRFDGQRGDLGATTATAPEFTQSFAGTGTRHARIFRGFSQTPMSPTGVT